jgi:hypothetical protein
MPASCAQAGAAAIRKVKMNPKPTRFALGIRLLEMLPGTPVRDFRDPPKKKPRRYDCAGIMERTLYVKRPKFKEEYSG